MVVKQIHSINDIENGGQISAVLFYSDGVQECDHMNVILDKLSDEPDYKSITFSKCLAEQSSTLAEEYKIIEVPTILFLVGNTCVEKLVGADAISLNKKLKQLSKQSPDDDNQSKLESKLKTLINYAPVMLFMKGTPVAPQCGFSRQIASILRELNADYKSFNILTDEEIRSGLKTYSNWPTYPQLYINGELIGGLDIVNELKTTGELQNMLSTTKNPESNSKLDDL